MSSRHWTAGAKNQQIPYDHYFLTPVTDISMRLPDVPVLSLPTGTCPAGRTGGVYFFAEHVEAPIRTILWIILTKSDNLFPNISTLNSDAFGFLQNLNVTIKKPKR